MKIYTDINTHLNINMCINIIQCVIMINFMYWGTKIINYYYNFYHIYTFLNWNQKISYFKNTWIVEILSKNALVKKIIVSYFLIPLIKINYIFIYLLVALLCSLCHEEFAQIILTQNLLSDKHKEKHNKILLSINESNANTNIDINAGTNMDTNMDTNIDTNTNVNTNINNDELKLDNNELQLNEYSNKLINNIHNSDNVDIPTHKINLTTEIDDICNISSDYDNDITNIINIVSSSLESTHEQNTKNINNIDKTNEKKFSENNNDLKLNLINEIDLLNSIDKDSSLSKISLEPTNILQTNSPDELDDYMIKNDVIVKEFEQNELENYLIEDNALNNVLSEEIKHKETNTNANTNTNTNINVNTKISELKVPQILSTNNNMIETIGIDEIDFGIKIEDFGCIKTKEIIPNNVQGLSKTNVIRIGKKKNKNV